jgi:hypothetical protein
MSRIKFRRHLNRGATAATVGPKVRIGFRLEWHFTEALKSFCCVSISGLSQLVEMIPFVTV